MNWYQGGISEAITTSKRKGAIFVVYIEGTDEKSTNITNLINKSDVSEKLQSDNFVAIKIEADSLTHQQFSQIYKQTPVPSIYFIGKQGVTLEIVTEAKDAPTFSTTLDSICIKGGLSITPSVASQNFIENEQAQEVPPENLVCDNGVCTIKKDESVSSSSASQSEKKDDNKELTSDEKVERARQLLDAKREEKKREEEQNERLKEIERRKMGQNVQQMKKLQEDQELKQLLEEREKEKRESQAARERVLAQIAQDRAERAARYTSTPTPQPKAAAAPAPRPQSNSQVARIQFKMPDGRTSMHDFASSDTLETVHAYIRDNLNLTFSSYSLSTTFPRREFCDADRSQTLMDLELAPSSVILILPLNRGTVSTHTDGGLAAIFWMIISPIFTIFDFIKNFLFGKPDNEPTTNTETNKRAADTQTQSRSQVKRRAGESTVVKRHGNVHGLANKNDDDDDENNTWNGNSTQQM